MPVSYQFKRDGVVIELGTVCEEYHGALSDIGVTPLIDSTGFSQSFDNLIYIGIACYWTGSFDKKKLDTLEFDSEGEKRVVLDFLNGTYKFSAWR